MAARRLLVLARRRAGLTQRELAERSGVPQSTIARIESGRTDPRTKTLERLLKACDQTLEVYEGSGEGVDRTMLRELLKLTPDERVQCAVRAAHALATLVREGVDFVLIGGIAANARGSDMATFDMDVCYSRAPENVERLVSALRALRARLHGVDDEVPFDVRTITAGQNFTFMTDAGPLDVLALPAGSRGYEPLAAAATPMEIGGVEVAVVSLEDLIAMKRAAGRPKDRIAVENLVALRDELDDPGAG